MCIQETAILLGGKLRIQLGGSGFLQMCHCVNIINFFVEIISAFISRQDVKLKNVTFKTSARL